MKHYREEVSIVLKYLLCVSCALICAQCVGPLDYDPELVDDIVVIEGFIDDDFGPHEIKVTYLASFAGVTEGGEVRRVDATVSIIDEFGNRTLLTRESGTIIDFLTGKIDLDCFSFLLSRKFQTNYMTPSTFKGEPGVSYSLELVDERTGKKYRSFSSKMPQRVPVEDVLFEFKKFPSENEFVNVTGVEVFSKWTDPELSKNFYWWEMEGTYKFETYPLPNDDCCLYDERDEHGTRCWKIEKNVDASTSLIADELFNGNNVIKKVGFIEDDGLRFSSNEVPTEKQYYLELFQYAIAEEAYEYMKTIRLLSEIDGEIFDSPPVTPIGNIYNLEDPQEIVIGYFGVYSKSSYSIFLDREILLERKLHGLCSDCRHLNFQGQLEIPDVYK